MSGYVIKLGKGAKVKGGKIKISPVYRDASHAIAAKKSKCQRVVRRNPA
jgi:hypothetical protein